MPHDPNNPDDRNLNWVRPAGFRADWPDYDSVNWKRMVEEMERKQRECRERYGFVTCPRCQTVHTCKTMSCRGCSYQVVMAEEAHIKSQADPRNNS